MSDACSADDTISILERHNEMLAWWQSAKDKGIYDAWNQALERATGEYVMFLGADDQLADDNVIGRMLAAIGNDEYDLVTSLGLVFDPTSRSSVVTGNPWNYDRIGPRMIVCHPGLLHRRSLFASYGPFDDTYKITGDLDFLLRLPRDLRTLHVPFTTTLIQAGGVSQRSILTRLREQRRAVRQCPRHGAVAAYKVWLGKLIKYPIARLLRIPF